MSPFEQMVIEELRYLRKKLDQVHDMAITTKIRTGIIGAGSGGAIAALVTYFK
jgi:hypothetical protein